MLIKMDNLDIVFFDLETTGTSVSQDKIVQISCIKTDYQLIKKDETKKYLINPGIPIPPEATAVHGITDEMVKNAPTFAQYAEGLVKYIIGCILAGYNIKHYDIPLLVEEFLRVGIDVSKVAGKISAIDACEIYRIKEARTLTAALKFYAGMDHDNAHDAEADNIATINVLQGQMLMYNMSVQDCVEFCASKDMVDFAGKIILIDGEACYSFGKDKGKSVKKYPGFGRWMLQPEQNFTQNTKKRS